MTNIVDLFKTMMIVQLFYSFCITLLIYGMPADAIDQVSSFSDITNRIDLNTVSTQFEESIEKQTNIPLVEVGALIFYSGNILLDLLLNFVFAIPEMIGIILNGLLLLISVDSGIVIIVETFTAAVIMVVYFLGLIQLITGLRTGRAIE